MDLNGVHTPLEVHGVEIQPNFVQCFPGRKRALARWRCDELAFRIVQIGWFLVRFFFQFIRWYYCSFCYVPCRQKAHFIILWQCEFLGTRRIQKSREISFTDLRCRVSWRCRFDTQCSISFVITAVSELFSPFLVFFLSDDDCLKSQPTTTTEFIKTYLAYTRYRETQYSHSVELRAVVMAYLSNCLYFSHSAFVLFCFVLICFHFNMRMCGVRPDRDRAERWTIDAFNDDAVLRKKLQKRNTGARVRCCLCEHYFVSLNGNWRRVRPCSRGTRTEWLWQHKQENAGKKHAHSPLAQDFKNKKIHSTQITN